MMRAIGNPTEWPATLDISSLFATGWKPEPFREFVIKMHSRCNLACEYCYMYTMPDQSWRDRPRIISSGIVSVVADRIAEHARTHSLESVRLIFHGGEPLLSGSAPLADAVRKVRAAVDAGTRVQAVVQTNGTLLDSGVLAVLEALDIRVGVSLDGVSLNHDKNRRHADGRGSYDEVVRGLRLLGKHPKIYGGLLSVVDLEADPVRTYEALLEFDPPTLDFLLPIYNWSRPPPRPEGSPDAYGEWLVAVFDRWYGSPERETRIRVFEEIINLLLGGLSVTEAIGLTPSSLIVVETDGTIEQADVLKSAYPGACATGLHVTRDSFDAALRLPHIVARQIGADALGDECQVCLLKAVCGGGLYAHRYKAGDGFRNRSVFCPDLFTLITHIKDRLYTHLRCIHAH